ncbi:MAG TPA: EF-Tu/IF-2/RF-3 family GTPase [Planctomycetota bacterium]|nr:EF-Tu/IF-2/RF-3 family GTPase [Planctomycetota bacterium]
MAAASRFGVPGPREDEAPLLLQVEDVFSIAGRGTVVTGTILRGVVKVGDRVELVGLRETVPTARVGGVEMFQRTLDRATVGDNVGVLLTELTKEQVERGMVLAKPGSIIATREFAAELRFENGFSGMESSSGASSALFELRGAHIKGEFAVATGSLRALPGESARVEVRLDRPIAIEPDVKLRLFEGTRTIAIGRVLE